ncbi:MAG: RagB/SusD family nutrient uptake outer membrane protein [Prolixibacteraceae bacterium]
MKRIHIKASMGTVLMTLFLMACSNILEETPRGIYTPDYFKSEKGVMGGLTSMYAHLRFLQPNGYYYASCQAGTDEGTWGQNVNADAKNLDLSGVGAITSQQNPAGGLWSVFPNINTASGIIENAIAVGTISPALIAEARFFRAWDYFMLVQTFGGVPLDLGGGDLKFNTSTVRTSKRNTVPQVYTKAIFPDLITAIKDLPSTARLTGTVTKTVASLYLAKAYLTYAWWLENPNAIPTYPTSDRTDPDGHNAAWYYAQAYTVATAAIVNPGPFGLQSYYYDVNVGSKDRNKEVLLYPDHTEASELYNQQSLSYSTGASGDYFANWLTTWNYTNIKSSTSASSFVGFNTVQRYVVQAEGRPWCGIATPIGAITNTFADKTNDSRYDGTFGTVFRGNWKQAGSTITTMYNANFLPIVNGDPVLTFLDSDPGTVVYGTGLGNSNVNAGVMPGRADWVIPPRGISRLAYPSLWKIGPYRTDNGTGLGQQNAGNTRPFPIAKFSELFLVAAEAAVKGAPTQSFSGTYANDGTARGLLNVLRARAGKWYWSNNGNAALVADNSAAMIAATPASIDVNYVLAERSRELFGEAQRWFDLVRTQKWAEIAGTYEICGNAGSSTGDHIPVVVTRTIDKKYYLRPIPQGQLDGMEMTDAEKAAYQNPGY